MAKPAPNIRQEFVARDNYRLDSAKTDRILTEVATGDLTVGKDGIYLTGEFKDVNDRGRNNGGCVARLVSGETLGKQDGLYLQTRELGVEVDYTSVRPNFINMLRRYIV